MTPEELKRKLEAIELDSENDIESVKQLIRDCIEAVTPRTQPGEGRQALLHTREWYDGYNQAIDTIEQNTKDLLG